MSSRYRIIGMLGIGAAALVMRCANPFGGGGTETSNPGMYACAHAVFEEVESPGNWSPESYLPSGGAELDPERSATFPARSRIKPPGETYTAVDSAAQRTGIPEMRLLSFQKQQNGVCTALSVHFNAGNDRRFGSTADNRILRLDRELAIANTTLERIAFRDHPALHSGDSLELVFDRHHDTGLIRDATVRYVMLPGALSRDQRFVRLAALQKAIAFRKSPVQSVEVRIEFEPSGAASPFYDKATVQARMYYGLGHEGIFTGTVNGRGGTLSGRYTEGGRERCVEYVRAGNTLSWKEREPSAPLPDSTKAP